MPGIFAADFFEYFGENSKFYVFIDTYEALWEGLRDKGSFHEKDKWIRDNLIQNMLGVSWVICGREKLLWVQECDSDWDMYLEQRLIDELQRKDCTKFLVNCGIGSKDIRNVIIEASERVPYYLNLSVDTFEKINRKRQPISEDFGKTQPEIFNTFVKYLNHNEVRALEVLSAPNFWDRNLFEILMKKFDTGFPAGAFSELIKFSFIKTDSNEKYYIHQLMRKSLQEHQDSTDRKNTHQFLLAYYSDKIEDLDIKAITPEHELALTEAFYHAKEVLEAEKLCEWLISSSNPFYRAAFWQLIAPMYEEMLQILEAELDPQHPDIGGTLNNLAGLYEKMGEYEKALPLYQKALEIAEKVLGPQHPYVAITLNNLAGLYGKIGEYEKALPLCQQALAFHEKVLGSQHPYVAITLNTQAILYYQTGNYERALSLYQRALDIHEKVLGPQHPDVANTLNSLAVIYEKMGEYEKALLFNQRAFDIRENILGPQHPDVATTLNSLAVLYKKIGEYEKALPLYQKALGPEHPYVANTLNNLAGLYGKIGEYEKALSLYQKALDIREKALGSQHQDVANTLNNLAALYHHVGEYEKALLFNQRALEIVEKKLGQDHPNTIIVKNNYNKLLSKISKENGKK